MGRFGIIEPVGSQSTASASPNRISQSLRKNAGGTLSRYAQDDSESHNAALLEDSTIYGIPLLSRVSVNAIRSFSQLTVLNHPHPLPCSLNMTHTLHNGHLKVPTSPIQHAKVLPYSSSGSPTRGDSPIHSAYSRMPHSSPLGKLSTTTSHHFVKSVRILGSPDSSRLQDKLQTEILNATTAVIVERADEHKSMVELIHQRNSPLKISTPEHCAFMGELELQRIRFEKMNESRNQQLQNSILGIKQRNSQLVKNIQESINDIKERERERQQKSDYEAQVAAAKKKASDIVKAEAEKKAKFERDQTIALEAAASLQKKAQEDAKIALEAEARAVKEKAAQIVSQEAALKAQAANDNIPHIVSKDAWKVAAPYIESVMRIKNTVKPAVMGNPALCNRVFSAKMSITQRTGQLTRSQKKVVEIVKSLHVNLTEASSDPQLYELVMDLTAKQIIKQAETEVAVKRNMAFPLAIVCVLLFEKHPQFLSIFLGRLMKKCPFIVPRYIRKLPSDSLADYMKRSGYKEIDGKLESEIQYGERMCGILSLYAAIVQTSNIPNSYNIANGWVWMSRILNMKPRRITTLLLYTFLEIAGNALVTTYKRQAIKLVRYIVQVLIPMAPAAANASTTRLALFLDETVLKTGNMPPFEGSALEA
ncbi:hypothetical protein BASA61_008454 [Batrachochytrium salamandrivorans]|nr:hypothetical protein BASA61_008454 [Batrachochytrium salamandrivorans]